MKGGSYHAEAVERCGDRAGRLGRVYAADPAHRVPNARLVAVADKRSDLAEAFAREHGVPKWYASHEEAIADKEVEAVAVITPTSTHREVVTAAAEAGKAIFCEKPIALTLEEAGEMLERVQSARVFLQMGFQRRFDAGYVAAKEKLDAGLIGLPVLIACTSRDPFRPPLEFCDPGVSGGLITDMGIHDFDVARMFLGEVERVCAVGGALASPELRSVGDIDNAVIEMVFENGAPGVVALSRNAVFGYDIRAEIWGTEGSLQLGCFRHTPALLMTKEGIAHDVVPHLMQRFDRAGLPGADPGFRGQRAARRIAARGGGRRGGSAAHQPGGDEVLARAAARAGGRDSLKAELRGPKPLERSAPVRYGERFERLHERDSRILLSCKTMILPQIWRLSSHAS
ncbi:MAG: Gfo/Idh/MocA family oxidoreductase [Bryobacteraceae bacterium]|nr:Gfo/Idh/MocA family oxidoreductase [Bryobacteraceae bacterium]